MTYTAANHQRAIKVLHSKYSKPLQFAVFFPSLLFLWVSVFESLLTFNTSDNRANIVFVKFPFYYLHIVRLFAKRVDPKLFH